MTEPNRYRTRSDGLSWRNVGDEAVILDLNTSQYLTLNPTGAFLWEAMANGAATRDELVDLLIQEFDVSRDVASIDVEEFIVSCLSKDLLLRA